MDIRCSQCRAPLRVPGDAPEQAVRCPRCNVTFRASDRTPQDTESEVTTTSTGSGTPEIGSGQDLAGPPRRDLSVWFEFGPDEHPLMFLADRDPAGSDTGPTGLMVTDRRVVYRNREGQGPTTATRPNRILLVEDNPGDVRLVQEALTEGKVSSNLEVVIDGRQAIEYLHRKGVRGCGKAGSDPARPEPAQKRRARSPLTSSNSSKWSGQSNTSGFRWQPCRPCPDGSSSDRDG